MPPTRLIPQKLIFGRSIMTPAPTRRRDRTLIPAMACNTRGRFLRYALLFLVVFVGIEMSILVPYFLIQTFDEPEITKPSSVVTRQTSSFSPSKRSSIHFPPHSLRTKGPRSYGGLSISFGDFKPREIGSMPPKRSKTAPPEFYGYRMLAGRNSTRTLSNCE